MSQRCQSESQPAQPADFNDADVTFLQWMFPHHAQAIEMAKLMATWSQNQEVLGLAAAMAQGSEIKQSRALLKQFGKPEMSTMMEHEGMAGMASKATNRRAGSRVRPDFDRRLRVGEW